MVDDAAKDAVIRRRALVGTFSNYAGRFVKLGTWFFLTPFILHELGAEDYGLWVLVGSVVAYGALLDLGIGGAVTKYVAEYMARGETDQARSLVATALRLYSGLGLIAVVLSAGLAFVFPGLFNVPPERHATATWLVLLMGLALGISLPYTTAGAVLRGLQRHDLLNYISATGTLLSAAATVVVLLMGGALLGMVAVNIPITLLMQGASVRAINRSTPELRFGWAGAEWRLVRRIISFSFSIFVVQGAGLVQTKTDEIVIGVVLPISAITPYAIARKLSELPQILTDQFMKVLLPLASELHADDDQARLRALYLESTRLTLAIFLPVACTLIVLARPILTAWVGAAYADNAHLLVILTVASLIATSQWPAGSILQGMARHGPLAIMTLGSAVANLALSITLVHRLGLAGVALGTLIPTAVEGLFFVLPYAMRTIGVSGGEGLKRVLMPALCPAIPMIIVLYLLERVVEPSSWWAIAAVAAAGSLVYVAAYLRVGASEFERQTYRTLAASTLRLARAGSKQ